MLVYFYDPETKILAGSKQARLSPLDKKQGRTVYLCPANATFTPPVDDTTIFWNGNEWVAPEPPAEED